MQKHPPPKKVTKILTYPPPPQTGGVTITSEDMHCLDEGAFLNDAVIDFYLKYVFHEKLSEFYQERTHIFSSYFYPRLTQKSHRSRPGVKDAKTLKCKRHGHVKTWTKNVDIFSKDYIIIPINQNEHWLLAIICFPGLVPDSLDASSNQEQRTIVTNSVDSFASTTGHEVANHSCVTIKDQHSETDDTNHKEERNSNAATSSCSSLFKLGIPHGSENPVLKTSDDSMAGTKAQDGKLQQKEMPCICIFDSLSGPSRWKIVTALREYLEMEWKSKTGTTRIFDLNTMRRFDLQCPQQTNFSDCGIYVLQYMESFFENPLPYFGQPSLDLSNWFTESDVANKREQLKSLIYGLKKKHFLSRKLANSNSEKQNSDRNPDHEGTSSSGTVQKMDKS